MTPLLIEINKRHKVKSSGITHYGDLSRAPRASHDRPKSASSCTVPRRGVASEKAAPLGSHRCPHRIGVQNIEAANARLGFVLVSVARALVVLLALQISGVGHALADTALFRHEGSCATHTATALRMNRGTTVRPGCPTCHHAHGGVGPLAPTSFTVTPIAPQVARFAPRAADDPPSPELPSVFRPPQAQLAVSTRSDGFRRGERASARVRHANRRRDVRFGLRREP